MLLILFQLSTHFFLSVSSILILIPISSSCSFPPSFITFLSFLWGVFIKFTQYLDLPPISIPLLKFIVFSSILSYTWVLLSSNHFHSHSTLFKLLSNSMLPLNICFLFFSLPTFYLNICLLFLLHLNICLLSNCTCSHWMLTFCSNCWHSHWNLASSCSSSLHSHWTFVIFYLISLTIKVLSLHLEFLFVLINSFLGQSTNPSMLTCSLHTVLELVYTCEMP